jgi:hypothetical protein
MLFFGAIGFAALAVAAWSIWADRWAFRAAIRGDGR